MDEAIAAIHRSTRSMCECARGWASSIYMWVSMARLPSLYWRIMPAHSQSIYLLFCGEFPICHYCRSRCLLHAIDQIYLSVFHSSLLLLIFMVCEWLVCFGWVYEIQFIFFYKYLWIRRFAAATTAQSNQFTVWFIQPLYALSSIYLYIFFLLLHLIRFDLIRWKYYMPHDTNQCDLEFSTLEIIC